jgi:DNA-binding Lrp family transcriptional regulator
MFGEERVTTYSGLVRVLRERITSYVTEGIERARALRRMPEVIDVYEVTGEYDIIATAKANDLQKT